VWAENACEISRFCRDVVTLLWYVYGTSYKAERHRQHLSMNLNGAVCNILHCAVDRKVSAIYSHVVRVFCTVRSESRCALIKGAVSDVHERLYTSRLEPV
jgi:hypothetical protein